MGLTCRRTLTYDEYQVIGEPGLRAVAEVFPGRQGPVVWCEMDSNTRMQRIALWLSLIHI